MEKLFIATSNKNKIREIDQILKENGYEFELVYPSLLNDTDEPEENGTTFAENALIKAKYYFEKYGFSTIADDSGICIAHLNGGPGIYSARFKSEMDYPEKNRYICDLLKDAEDRSAYYACAVAYFDKDGNSSVFEGYMHGQIAYEASGTNGFGYDPIFFLPEFGKTVADLPDGTKSRISHRFKAINAWVTSLEK